ncbi:DUF3040 domain-containing protein [Corynebacterium auris]|uniref:DUF3040 domain-containing protein n=1 Tax=Corynebacterium auris TaxID=44750 RepID=UPI0025B5E425|nr:DUF3040 domain-containing protein [Corynebacterium auris]WJY68409.1 hypothetical protein CAURIS_07570 [Corynebacterium auris]
MSLSEQEQRALQEIERSLLAEDPSFASNMPDAGSSSVGGGTGRLTMRSVAVIVLGLVLLIGGVALATVSMWLIALSVVGFIVMLVGGIMALRAPAQGPVERPGAARAKKSSPRATSMEENFRRRFES